MEQISISFLFLFSRMLEPFGTKELFIFSTLRLSGTSLDFSQILSPSRHTIHIFIRNRASTLGALLFTFSILLQQASDQALDCSSTRVAGPTIRPVLALPNVERGDADAVSNLYWQACSFFPDWD